MREQLQNIRMTKSIDGVDLPTLINWMLENIGDLDPELRDDNIYSVFSWLILKGHINNEKLKAIAFNLIGENHIFYGISESSTKVYTRTFSVLLLAPIIYLHRKKPFFSQDELRNLFEATIKYFNEEKDLHGYTKEYGWAHSVAHTADVLDEFALCPELNATDLELILESIRDKVCTYDYIYQHGEDDRLVVAIESVIERDLFDESDLIKWLEGFEASNVPSEFINGFVVKTNIRNFMRSLYFNLKKRDVSEKVCAYILSR